MKDKEIPPMPAEARERIRQAIAPTLAEWMDRYEAELESGQSRISRAEAERRFHAQNQEE
jgi:hypothetical protein